MADAVATQILVDGPRNAIIKFTNISDNTGESAVTKVDVSTLSEYGKGWTEVRITGIKASTFGMGVNILWDADTDVLAWHIPADMDVDQCFEKFGGLPNNATDGKTGDIKFTTTGQSLGDAYCIILELKKGS